MKTMEDVLGFTPAQRGLVDPLRIAMGWQFFMQGLRRELSEDHTVRFEGAVTALGLEISVWMSADQMWAHICKRFEVDMDINHRLAYLARLFGDDEATEFHRLIPQGPKPAMSLDPE